MTRMLIIGPPGSGKGTQAERISERLGVVAISTGDIFRAHVKGGTPLGLEARKYIDAGDFVPDSVTNEMVRSRLSADDVDNGFLLDGYPRTRAQVDELDAMLAEGGHALQAVVELTVDPEEVVARLLRRAVTEGRADDTEDVIRRRQQVYRSETQPLLDYYRDLLITVDGVGEVDEVTDRLLGALRDDRT